MIFTTEGTWTQTVVFAVTVNSGLVLGFLYCFFDGVKKHCKKRAWKNVWDIFFSLLFGVVLFLTLYIVNDGKINIYTVVGFLLGIAISVYSFKTFARKIVDFWVKQAKKLQQLLHKLP